MKKKRSRFLASNSCLAFAPFQAFFGCDVAEARFGDVIYLSQLMGIPMDIWFWQGNKRKKRRPPQAFPQGNKRKKCRKGRPTTREYY